MRISEKLTAAAILLLGASLASAQSLERSAFIVGGGTAGAAGIHLQAALGQAVVQEGAAGYPSGSAGRLYTGFLHQSHRPGTTLDLAGTSSSAGALSLAWTSAGVDGFVGSLAPGEFRIDYSSDPAHPFLVTTFRNGVSAGTASPLAPGSAQFFGVSSLLGNATYFIRLFTLDASSMPSRASLPAAVLTRAYAPGLEPLSSITLSTSAATLLWGLNNNTPATQFRVELSNDPLFSALRAASSFEPTLNHTFTGLEPDTTYYARVKARNAAGVETAYLALGSVLLLPVLPVRAMTAFGLEGTAAGTSFDLAWEPVQTNLRGEPASIQGYTVYRATDPLAAPTLLDFVSQSSTTLSYSDPEGALTPYFFLVRSVDDARHESPDSLWVRSQGSPRFLAVGRDCNLSVSLTPEDVAALPAQVVDFDDRPEDVGGTVIRSCEARVLDARTGSALEGFSFPSGRNVLTFRLPSDFAGPAAQALGSRDVAIFYDNGVEFTKLGGDVDTASNSISIQYSRTGVYQVRRSLRSQAFAIMNTEPRKIFTPNGDGVWDRFIINFDNPAGVPASQVLGKVFDITAAEVAELKPGPTSCATFGSHPWDGRDSRGQTVPSGIYIWQIKAEGEVFNGTAVVAK